MRGSAKRSGKGRGRVVHRAPGARQRDASLACDLRAGSRWSPSAVGSMGALLSSGITSDMKFRGGKPDSVIGQKLAERHHRAAAHDRLRHRALGRPTRSATRLSGATCRAWPPGSPTSARGRADRLDDLHEPRPHAALARRPQHPDPGRHGRRPGRGHEERRQAACHRRSTPVRASRWPRPATRASAR